ncbi:uncharacterized protein BDV17DRAFT_207180 [Aspergillus undulatus]|uniref:uncharacterized protein n=1 Tax=Aspergillus undulatus TaxID=1810928 RepID=UPI003CCDF223
MDDYTGEKRPCYFPEGNLAPNNVPCSGERYTSCCGYQDICLSNGLCLATEVQPYVISRGACTNQNWDSGCPEYCREDTPDRGSSIINYSFDISKPESRYCCGLIGANNGTTNCGNGRERITIATGYPLPGVGLLANTTLLSQMQDDQTSNSNDTCLTQPTAD